MNQSQRMLEYMLQGHTLTGLQAIQMFGTTTPSKRFSEIREMLERMPVFMNNKIYGWGSFNCSLHSEARTNGKNRWLEYSVRIIK